MEKRIKALLSSILSQIKEMFVSINGNIEKQNKELKYSIDMLSYQTSNGLNMQQIAEFSAENAALRGDIGRLEQEVERLSSELSESQSSVSMSMYELSQKDAEIQTLRNQLFDANDK